MNKYKNLPRCPYCGAEMRLEDNEDVLFGLFADEEKMYWYQCNAPSCGIHSPANHTKAGAYKAAMRRYEEPNRVLTLDELKHYNGFIWCESRDGEVFEPGWVEDMYAYVRECETINLCNENIDWSEGRCWLRKPTEQEMENTPWEDEGR